MSTEMAKKESAVVARNQAEATWSFIASLGARGVALNLLSPRKTGTTTTLWTIAVYCSCVAFVLSLYSVYRSYFLWKSSDLGLGKLALRLLWAMLNIVTTLIFLMDH